MAHLRETTASTPQHALRLEFWKAKMKTQEKQAANTDKFGCQTGSPINSESICFT